MKSQTEYMTFQTRKHREYVNITEEVAGVVRREAFVMAYGDCFYLLGVLLLAMALLVWFCRGAKGGALAAH